MTDDEYGTPGRPRLNLHVRFWTNVLPPDENGCWIWTGYTSKGYGRIRLPGRGPHVFVHRWVYELMVGPIPAGLTLDHVWARGCRSKACVNPEHLEPVTTAENSARKVRKSECPSGHPFVGDNIKINKRGAWVCRTCANAASREWGRRRRAA